jgi:hypothetical protein
MATLEDNLVTDAKVTDNIFSDSPPAGPDLRAHHLAVCMVNRKPLVIDFGPTAASDILAVDTSVLSSPPSPLLSQTLLSPPMMRNSGEGFLSVSTAWGRRTTPSELAVLCPVSVVMAPTNLFGALSTVSLENSTDPKGDPTPPKPFSSLQALVDDTYGVFFGPN